MTGPVLILEGTLEEAEIVSKLCLASFERRKSEDLTLEFVTSTFSDLFKVTKCLMTWSTEIKEMRKRVGCRRTRTGLGKLPAVGECKQNRVTETKRTA